MHFWKSSHPVVLFFTVVAAGLLGCSEQPAKSSDVSSGAKKASDTQQIVAADAAAANSAPTAVENEIASRTPATDEPIGQIPAVSDDDATIADKPTKKPVAGEPSEVQPATHVVDIRQPGVELSPLDGPPRIAKVQMSKDNAAECKLKVGDSLPALTLPDANGNSVDLAEARGSKLTVLFFWNADNPYAMWQLGDVMPDVVVPYEAKGVNVIGIYEGEDPSTAKAALAGAKAQFTTLIDADGKALAEFGSDRLPRTYLVDAEGKILWFDIEYSRSTRRELRSALSYLLDPRPAAPPAIKTPAKKAPGKTPAKTPSKTAPKSTVKKPATK